MSPETIQLREAFPHEIGAIALVLARANAQRDGEPLPMVVDHDQVLAMEERVQEHNPHGWMHVAVDEQKQQIAGFAFGYPYIREEEIATESNADYLSLLMVEPDYWGNRVASRLLDLVAVEAQRADRQQVTLWTRDKDNTHARGVYEHKGYTLTGFTRNSRYGHQVEYQLDL